LSGVYCKQIPESVASITGKHNGPSNLADITGF
jgi:hypothetical protein